jgi:hypothetical protein
MNTKNIVLLGIGVVVVYLILNKKKDTTNSIKPMVDQAKIDKCNEEVALKLQTVKIASPEALEAFKKEVFENCMAKA